LREIDEIDEVDSNILLQLDIHFNLPNSRESWEYSRWRFIHSRGSISTNSEGRDTPE